MPLQSIEWLTEEDAKEAMVSLQLKFSDDPIYILDFNPIGYVLQLEAISDFFNDDLLLLGATIIRSIIKRHPLHDGNKRFGMILGTYFLALNGILITATDQAYFETALGLASGTINRDELFEWLRDNSSIDAAKQNQ